ncbi:MAG: V-type ATP synthase subunit I [Actinomycetia bacterium]|nr:V-type ATP synthase subunit I [Actinomycetes bacterium]
MAVAEIKKTYILALKSEKDEIITKLKDSGIVQIEKIDSEIKNEGELLLSLVEPDIHRFQSRTSQVAFLLKFLGNFKEKKEGMFAALTGKKIVIKKKDFEKIEAEFKLKELYENCEDLEVELNSLRTKIAQLNSDIKELLPWKDLDINFKQSGELKNCQVFFGKINKRQVEEVIGYLSKSKYIDYEIVSQNTKETFLSFLCHLKYCEEAVLEIGKIGFNQIQLSIKESSVKNRIEVYEKEILSSEQLMEKIEKKARTLLKNESKLLTLQDYYSNELVRLESEKNILITEAAFLIQGWIKASDEKKLKKLLEKNNCEIEILKPSKDEEPPIFLNNKKLIQPFEVLTELYGMPNYREIDPTPFLAPFFIVFFGICLGDVGYGLILMISSLLMMKKLNFKEQGKRFLTILFYGGFVAILFGIATGGWFAISMENLPIFLRKLVLLDPLSETGPNVFLVISLFLGLFQLLVGVAMEMFDNFRKKKFLDGFLDQGPIMMFIPGATLLVMWLFQGMSGAPKPFWADIGVFLFSLSSLMIILFSNRESGGFIGRIIGGIYSLYGMTSYISDAVSYARLMALGLATMLVGWAVNIMVGLVFTSLPVIGFIGAAVIFVFGHIVNLVISLIGSFVHPLRLQYVEFFTKFFENGGSKFNPLKIETKNIIIK